MPSEDLSDPSTISRTSRTNTQRGQSTLRKTFEIPTPIKHVFSRFPLVTYSANELPPRSPRVRSQHALHIFKVKGSTGVEASCNPSCLKWQTYLKLLKIPFVSVASSNHASPSGSLPFLLPAPSKGPASQPPSPVTANKLLRWSKGEAKITDEVSDVRLEAYEALLDGPIRKAWLFHLYLCHPNFSSVAAPCYIQPSSSNPLVGAALSYELRSAATAEILKSSSLTAAGPFKVLDAESLYVQAEDALSALSTLLGTHEWFFDAKQPGLMDASVFSYTHLLLDDALEWSDKRLNDDLRKYKNLVIHRDRILERYF